MKAKILVLPILFVLCSLMMTSCLVVFPSEYEVEYQYSNNSGSSSSSSSYVQNQYGTIQVTNNIRDGYISEISYGRNAGSNSIWTFAWNDGHTYDYRASSSDYYWGTKNGNVYTCKIPVGTTDIRVTVVYKYANGTYQYEDFICEDKVVSKNGILYLSVD